MSKPEQSGALAPEIEAKRQVVADFLTESMRHGHDPVSVRILFDEARYAETIYESAVRVQAQGETLEHDSDELVQVAARSFDEAATLAGLIEYHRRLDLAA
jgi:hypothetical protein